MKKPQPWEDKWTADWGFMAAKYPVILTEVGFCGADDVGAHIPVISDESYGDAMVAYCRNKGISLVAWVLIPIGHLVCLVIGSTLQVARENTGRKPSGNFKNDAGDLHWHH